MLTNLNPWLAGGALLTIIATCWSRIRMLLARLFSLAVVKVRVEDDVGKALAAYCWKHFKRSPYGERRYSSMTAYVQPVERYQTVGFEHVGTDPVVFWKGWRPLLMTYSISTINDHTAGSSLTATFLRGTFDIESLIVEALDEFNRHKHEGTKGERFCVDRVFGQGARRRIQGKGYGEQNEAVAPSDVSKEDSPDRRYLKWQTFELGAGKGNGDPFGALALSVGVLEVVDHARRWLASEKWYKQKRIPWRLGFLFHGAPGTGKSSVAAALGKELDLPVISFDLASFDNQEFTRRWDKLLNQAPCIALLEDIDAVFDGRENRLGKEGGGLTFDCLLNCISGVCDASGVLPIVTTNRVECLDEALGKPDGDRGVSTRPGRIDRAVELPRLDAECRRRVAARILADCPWEIDQMVEESEGDSGSQLQSRCEKVALAHYWGAGYQRNGHATEVRV